MKKLSDLSIPEKAIIHCEFQPNDTVSKSLFNSSNEELNLIKLLSNERFNPATISINPLDYKNEIEIAISDYQKNPPTTKVKIRKPRGRTGIKIIKAFSLIPSTPVNAEKFAKDNEISVSVLRQYSRFDRTNLKGKVFVRKDAETEVLMVWRSTVND